MKVYLGVPRGFCAGVVRAIDVVELALKRFGPTARVCVLPEGPQTIPYLSKEA